MPSIESLENSSTPSPATSAAFGRAAVTSDKLIDLPSVNVCGGKVCLVMMDDTWRLCWCRLDLASGTKLSCIAQLRHGCIDSIGTDWSNIIAKLSNIESNNDVDEHDDVYLYILDESDPYFRGSRSGSPALSSPPMLGYRMPIVGTPTKTRPAPKRRRDIDLCRKCKVKYRRGGFDGMCMGCYHS